MDVEVAFSVDGQRSRPRHVKLSYELPTRTEDVYAPRRPSFRVTAHVHIAKGVDGNVRVIKFGAGAGRSGTPRIGNFVVFVGATAPGQRDGGIKEVLFYRRLGF